MLWIALIVGIVLAVVASNTKDPKTKEKLQRQSNNWFGCAGICVVIGIIAFMILMSL